MIITCPEYILSEGNFFSGIRFFYKEVIYKKVVLSWSTLADLMKMLRLETRIFVFPYEYFLGGNLNLRILDGSSTHF